MLFKSYHRSALITFLVAIILLLSLSNSVSIEAAASWSIVMLIAYGQRLILVSKFLEVTPNTHDMGMWLNRFNISTAICGLAWGSAGLIIFPSHDTELQAFLGLTLAGICAGSLISYSIKNSTALSFICGLAALAIPAFLNSHNPYKVHLLAEAVIFVIFMALISKQLAHSLLNNIKLRINAEKHQNEITQLAYYDSLTNLPNRGLLQDKLKQAILASESSQSYAMVVYIDLDNFKAINDAKGHAAGDLLLIRISNRLQKAVRKQDTVARVGGDEFILVLPDIGKTSKEAHAFSQQVMLKIIQAVKAPVEYKGDQLLCSASTGICLFMGDAIDADELTRRADMSMYLAKKQGQSSYQYYDETMQPKYDYQQELKNELNGALVDNQFQLYLQGQFNKEAECIGAEVLLRWQHPKHGFVQPTDFIPLIEESGLIVPVGNWVMHQACVLLKKWETSPLTKKLTLSVNVSAVQFNHQNFISEVESAIQSSGCDATRLCIELTESAVVNSIEDIVYKMNYLNSMGISLAIDDFGIGYSSLSILKRLPIDELKIDKMFVQDISKGNVEGAIVQSILQMGKNLKLRVVAEGIETEFQMKYLMNYGCKIFQGYLFEKPSDIEAFEKKLATNKTAVKTNTVAQLIS